LARTWSTAPTHPSRAPAKSACSFPISADTSPLVLASRSPQRRAILEQIGVAFEVRVTDVEELTTGPPEEVALENAYRKAAAVRAPPSTTVLGVDTIVAVGATIYGKPADRAGAGETLRALAGRRHAVISGLCLIEGERVRTAAARTLVEFRPLPEAAIDRYLDSDEWRGRAGGYAIQGRGALLVRAIEGDYLNVVGLPVAALVDLAPWLIGP
jgi:nucleoside triphosphate pyrophosphatase